MIHLVRFEPQTTATFNAGIIEIDADPLAERYIVMDRLSLNVLWHGVTPATGNAKIIVPFEYTNNYSLMALIIDDAGDPLHYVTGNDKVQASIVNARIELLNP